MRDNFDCMIKNKSYYYKTTVACITWIHSSMIIQQKHACSFFTISRQIGSPLQKHMHIWNAKHGVNERSMHIFIEPFPISHGESLFSSLLLITRTPAYCYMYLQRAAVENLKQTKQKKLGGNNTWWLFCGTARRSCHLQGHLHGTSHWGAELPWYVAFCWGTCIIRATLLSTLFGTPKQRKGGMQK